MLLLEIENYIQTAGLATRKVDMEIGEIPSGTGDWLMLFAAGSMPPDNELDTEFQQVDFWTRYNSASEGYDKLRAVYELFHRAHHIQLGNYYIYLAEAMGQIEDMDRDLNHRKVWRLSINFVYRSITNVS